jgi:hypothetical protein
MAEAAAEALHIPVPETIMLLIQLHSTNVLNEFVADMAIVVVAAAVVAVAVVMTMTLTTVTPVQARPLRDLQVHRCNRSLLAFLQDFIVSKTYFTVPNEWFKMSFMQPATMDSSRASLKAKRFYHLAHLFLLLSLFRSDKVGDTVSCSLRLLLMLKPSARFKIQSKMLYFHPMTFHSCNSMVKSSHMLNGFVSTQSFKRPLDMRLLQLLNTHFFRSYKRMASVLVWSLILLKLILLLRLRTRLVLTYHNQILLILMLVMRLIIPYTLGNLKLTSIHLLSWNSSEHSGTTGR